MKHFNKQHYGDEALSDPSLVARQQAIEAEARPTFTGAFAARIGSMFAAQATAQLIGSSNNVMNKIGQKAGIESLRKFEGIDPVTRDIGTAIGNAVPQKVQGSINRFARKIKLNWSNEQKVAGEAQGAYNQATQDISRFIAMDTIYTLVSAGAVGPCMKFLRKLPGMSYKAKTHEGSPTFDESERIKVPANHYTDSIADEAPARAPRDLPNTPDTTITNVAAHTAPARETQAALS